MNLAETAVARIAVPRWLNPASIDYLYQQWDRIDGDHISVVLLEGESADFCLGMDLNWLAENDIATVEKAAERFSELLRTMRKSAFISLALVKGTTTGGGVGLCANCDYIIADEEASFRLTEGLLGLVPGIILPALLKRLSPQMIYKMVLTAHCYNAKEAAAIGLADEVAGTPFMADVLNQRIQSLLACKKQTVVDLKEILFTDNQSIISKGMNLLLERVGEPGFRNKMLSLSYLNKC